MRNWKLWDGVLCMALDKRKEHWLDLQEQCKKFDIDMVPFVCGDGSDTSLVYDSIDEVNPDVRGWGYSAAGHQKNHYNALLTQKRMIQRAKDNGWKSVLLLEDDAYILQRFTDVINKVEENMPDPNGWLLFYLGWWRGNEFDEWNCNIDKVYEETGKVYYDYIKDNVGGFHSVVVREELYDLILDMPMNNPLDTQVCYARQWIPSLMLFPKATHIKSLHSFTEGVTFQRKEMV